MLGFWNDPRQNASIHTVLYLQTVPLSQTAYFGASVRGASKPCEAPAPCPLMASGSVKKMRTSQMLLIAHDSPAVTFID